MNEERMRPDERAEVSCNPRRLFRQRQVLDTLRSYLELSDELLDDMNSKNILTDNDVDTLRRLPWPTNRNELLQMLIRMQWTEESFNEFCNILRRTETSVFNRMLADKLTDATFELSDAGNGRPSTAPGGVLLSGRWDDEAVTGRMPRPPTTSLDLLLEALPSPDRCAVQAMIRDRDERIAKLTKRIEQLENDLLGKKHALEDARIKNSLTERQLGDWLATLALPSHVDSAASDSDGEVTFKAGLDEVATVIGRQSERIAQLSADNNQLRVQLNDVERQASEQCARLTDRLQQAATDADAARRDREKLADELQTTQHELDRLGRTLATRGHRRSSDDSADDHADTGRSPTRMKSNKTPMKDHHPAESDNQSKKSAKPWQRQRKLSIDVMRIGRKDSDTTRPPRVRRGSIVEDGKKTDRTTSAAPTSGRLVVRRASISTVPATVNCPLSRRAASKPKANEH